MPFIKYLREKGLLHHPLLFTLSRSSWLALIPMSIVFITMGERKVSSLLLSLAIAMSLPFVVPEKVKERAVSTFMELKGFERTARIGKVAFDPSASERLLSFGDAIKAWKKKPLLGYGVRGKNFDGERAEKFFSIKRDATSLPFKGSAADVIVSADFIEHIDDTQKERFLDESMRLLRRDGRIIVFTPNRIREMIGAILRWLKGGEGTRLHPGLTTRFSFEKKLRKRGLSQKNSLDPLLI